MIISFQNILTRISRQYQSTIQFRVISQLANEATCQKKTHKANSKAEKKQIWHYNERGIRNRKLKQLLRKAENEDEDKSDEAVNHAKRLIGVFKHYLFDINEIKKLFFIKPKLLELSKTNITKRFRSFASISLPYETIKGMVLAYPGLLLMSNEVSLQNRVNVLQELSLFPTLDQQRSLYLIQKCPQLLDSCKNKNDLQKKIRMLEDSGLNKQQVFELVMKHPAVLSANIDAVKEKVNFITNEMNGRITLVVKFPRVLASSLTRLKERHAYLIHEGFLNPKSTMTENRLRSIVLTTDSDFIYRVTETKMKNFRTFQQDFKFKNNVPDGELSTEDIEDIERREVKLNALDFVDKVTYIQKKHKEFV